MLRQQRDDRCIGLRITGAAERLAAQAGGGAQRQQQLAGLVSGQRGEFTIVVFGVRHRVASSCRVALIIG